MGKDVFNRAQKGLLDYLKLKELKGNLQIERRYCQYIYRKKDSYPGYIKNIQKLIRKRHKQHERETGKSLEQTLQKRRYSSGN